MDFKISRIRENASWDEFFKRVENNFNHAHEEVTSRTDRLDSVAKLPYKKFSCYGSCPIEDNLKLVICKDCGMVIKPVGYGHHIKLKHGLSLSLSSGSESEDEYRTFLLSPLHFSTASTSVLPGEKQNNTHQQQSYYVEKLKDLKMVLSRTPKKISVPAQTFISQNCMNKEECSVIPSTHHYATRSKGISLDDDNNATLHDGNFQRRNTWRDTTPKSLNDDNASQKSWEDERARYWIKVEIIIAEPPPFKVLEDCLRERREKRESRLMGHCREAKNQSKGFLLPNTTNASDKKFEENKRPKKTIESPEMVISRLLKVPGLSFELRTGNGSAVPIPNLADSSKNTCFSGEILPGQITSYFDKEHNSGVKSDISSCTAVAQSEFKPVSEPPTFLNSKLVGYHLEQNKTRSLKISNANFEVHNNNTCLHTKARAINKPSGPYPISPSLLRPKPAMTIISTTNDSTSNLNGLQNGVFGIRKQQKIVAHNAELSNYGAISNHIRKRVTPNTNFSNSQNPVYPPSKKRSFPLPRHSEYIHAVPSNFVPQRYKMQTPPIHYQSSTITAFNVLKAPRNMNSDYCRNLRHQNNFYNSSYSTKIFSNNRLSVAQGSTSPITFNYSNNYEGALQAEEEQLIVEDNIDQSPIIPADQSPIIQTPKVTNGFRNFIPQNNRGVFLIQPPTTANSSNVVILPPNNSHLQSMEGKQLPLQEYCYIEDDASYFTNEPSSTMDARIQSSTDAESFRELAEYKKKDPSLSLCGGQKLHSTNLSIVPIRLASSNISKEQHHTTSQSQY